MIFSGSPIFYVNPETVKAGESTRLYMDEFPENKSIQISIEGYNGKPTNVFNLTVNSLGKTDLGLNVEADRPPNNYFIKYSFYTDNESIHFFDTIYVTVLAGTSTHPPPSGDTGKINRTRKIFFWDNELIANPPAQSWSSNNNAFVPVPKEFIKDVALTTNIVWSPDTSLNNLQYITINNIKLTANPLLDVTNEVKSGENTLQLDYAVRSPWGIPYLGGAVGKATAYLEISYSSTDTEETQINDIQTQHDQVGDGDLPPDDTQIVPDLDPDGNIRKTYTLTSYFWKKEQIFEPPATTDNSDKNAYCGVPIDQIVSATLKVDIEWGWFDAGVQLDSITLNNSNTYVKDIDNVSGPGDATLDVVDTIIQGENTLQLDYSILAPYVGGATGTATAYIEIKYKASDVEQTQIKLDTETYYKARAERSGDINGWLKFFGITEEMADTAKKVLLIGGLIIGAIIIIPPILNITKTYKDMKK